MGFWGVFLKIVDKSKRGCRKCKKKVTSLLSIGNKKIAENPSMPCHPIFFLGLQKERKKRFPQMLNLIYCG